MNGHLHDSLSVPKESARFGVMWASRTYSDRPSAEAAAALIARREDERECSDTPACLP